MSTPEEILAAAKSEIVTLLDKLPIEKLETIQKFAIQEVKNLKPEVQEAESRLKTIWNHLITAVETGEHAVVNDVHNFLVARGKIVPFPPAGQPAAATAPEAAPAPEQVSSPAPQQDVTATPAPQQA